jgi:hypothetical protein
MSRPRAPLRADPPALYRRIRRWLAGQQHRSGLATPLSMLPEKATPCLHASSRGTDGRPEIRLSCGIKFPFFRPITRVREAAEMKMINSVSTNPLLPVASTRNASSGVPANSAGAGTTGTGATSSNTTGSSAAGTSTTGSSATGTKTTGTSTTSPSGASKAAPAGGGHAGGGAAGGSSSSSQSSTSAAVAELEQEIAQLEQQLQQEQAQLQSAMAQNKSSSSGSAASAPGKDGNSGSEAPAQSKDGTGSGGAAVMSAQGAIATTEGQLETAVGKLAALLQGQGLSTSGSMVDTTA